ncbi:MAG TPA: hypothetical protein VFM05_14865, partial [Candidatus Saccharimonadales bacterium]|nr:hypothetical protein [Candidatus Saccharimonadales bacterium]
MSTSEQGNPAFNIYHDAKPVEPYLNPAYWNGHTLGIGEHQPFEPSVRAWRAAAFASTALRRYLSFQRPSF